MMIRSLLIALLSIQSIGLFAAELSQYTATRVQKAYELAQKEQFKQAIAALQQIETSRDYDQAFVARMLGVFYWQDGDSARAINYLTQAVNARQLQDEQGWTTEKMLADLLLSTQQYNKALPHYYALIEQSTIKPTSDTAEIWLRIAQAHYQIEQWRQVVAALKQYLKQKQGTFREKEQVQAFALMLGAQLQLKEWKGAITTTEKLILLQPDKQNWWRQLVGLQMQVKDSRSALSTLALAKSSGVMLSQDDRKLLAQLYAQQGIPERAAIEISGLDYADTDVELIVAQANHWQNAREWNKALQQWQRAAKLNAQYHWNVAQIQVQEGQYQQALETLAKVKGRESQVALAKTRAHFKLGDLENAIIQAKKADNIEPSQQSKSWIKYLSQLRKAQ